MVAAGSATTTQALMVLQPAAWDMGLRGTSEPIARSWDSVPPSQR